MAIIPYASIRLPFSNKSSACKGQEAPLFDRQWCRGVMPPPMRRGLHHAAYGHGHLWPLPSPAICLLHSCHEYTWAFGDCAPCHLDVGGGHFPRRFSSSLKAGCWFRYKLWGKSRWTGSVKCKHIPVFPKCLAKAWKNDETNPKSWRSEIIYTVHTQNMHIYILLNLFN